jgi:hypothetical protein
LSSGSLGREGELARKPQVGGRSWLLLGMTVWTTIKVPREVRDRLATAAHARGLTVRSLLEELSRKAVDDALMQRAAAQMEHLRDSDPESWAEYLREGTAWEQGTIERIET